MTLGVDPFRIDELFTDEQRMVRDAVRSFARAKARPVIRDHYRNGTFPRELVPEMAALGLFGATLEGYGCAHLGDIAYGLMMQELEGADSALRSFVSVMNGLVMFPIHAFGTEAQKSEWLPRMAEGKVIGCFGLTEPDFGSNPAGMRTSARRDGNSYVLNGTKMWITNGSIADVAVVFAKTEQGIQGFLVERGTPGFGAREIEGKLSLRASVTSELTFENCRIPLSCALPSALGLRAAFSCLNRARYSIAWGVLGAAQACFEEALEYAKQRVQFDRPIAGYQLVQAKLVHMWNEITKAQLLSYRLGQLLEQGKLDPVCISAAKRNNAQIALETARLARDILGANGITDDYAVMRHLCNLETVVTYEGTHDIHTLVLGHALTGLAAYSGGRAPCP